MLLFSVLVACAPPPYEPVAADDEVSVAITSPAPEEAAYGCVIVTVEVQNFRLVDYEDPDHQEPVEGEGHYHVLHAGGIARGVDPWVLVDFSADVTSTEAGELKVVLVGNDHQGVLDDRGNPVESSILFTYEPGTCTFTEEPGVPA